MTDLSTRESRVCRPRALCVQHFARRWQRPGVGGQRRSFAAPTDGCSARRTRSRRRRKLRNLRADPRSHRLLLAPAGSGLPSAFAGRRPEPTTSASRRANCGQGRRRLHRDRREPTTTGTPTTGMRKAAEPSSSRSPAAQARGSRCRRQTPDQRPRPRSPECRAWNAEDAGHGRGPRNRPSPRSLPWLERAKGPQSLPLRGSRRAHLHRSGHPRWWPPSYRQSLAGRIVRGTLPDLFHDRSRDPDLPDSARRGGRAGRSWPTR